MIEDVLPASEAEAIVDETTKRLGIDPKGGREKASCELRYRLEAALRELLEEFGHLDSTELRAIRVWTAFEDLQDALRVAAEAGDDPPMPDDLRIANPYEGIETWVQDLSNWAAKRTICTPAYLHGEALPAIRPPAARIVRNALFDFYSDTWREPDGGADTMAFLDAFYAASGSKLREFASSRLRISGDKANAWAPPPTKGALRKAVGEWRDLRPRKTEAGI